MTVGTIAVAALVGGEKVLKAIRGKTKAKLSAVDVTE
jgi:hypothetical protein